MKKCNSPVLAHREPGVDTDMYSSIIINLAVCTERARGRR